MFFLYQHLVAKLSRTLILMGVMIGVLLSAHGCKGHSALSEAEEYQQQGLYLKAIEGFRSYYLENPFSRHSAEALWRIGNIYRLNLKDFNKAVDAYKVLVNRFPESHEAREAQLLLGKIYASQFQDYERAVVEYQHVVLGKGYSDQEKAQAKLETGNAYYNLGNFQQARIEYEGLKQLYPDSLEGKRAILQLANTYDADSDYENALALYKQVAALDVKELAILGQFGVASCHEEMGHYEEALNMFNTILDKYPSRKVVEIRIERLTQRLHEVKSNH